MPPAMPTTEISSIKSPVCKTVLRFPTLTPLSTMVDMSVGNERSPTTSTAIITTANNAHFQYGLRAPNITLEAVSGLAGFEVLDTVLALSF